jgi:hypothetical protein
MTSSDNSTPIDITGATVKSKSNRLKQVEISNQDILAKVNEDYAFAMYGVTPVIIKTTDKPAKFYSEDAFKSKLNNRYVMDDKENAKKLAPYWLGWAGRREYSDIEFYPGEIKDKTIFNLWQGYAFEPVEGDCSLFLDHIKSNICDGNETLYNWLLDWMADAVQMPYRKNWTAILLQSTQEGTGKGFFATHFGKLFGYHYRAFNKPGQLLGKFNSHLEDKLILFLDEGSLLEKYAYDFAKSLITEPTLNIEPKGRSIREIQSYHRLIVASNDEEVLRASTTDRRWCVLEVKPYAQNNLDYFDDIQKQLNNGGYEALMFLLCNRQYNDKTVKTAPKTNALNKQKDRNLASHLLWWRTCLSSGRIGEFRWPSTISVRDFHKSYLNWCDDMKIHKRDPEHWLSRHLNEQAGTNLNSVRSENNYYCLTTIDDYRTSFEEALGYAIQWEDQNV